MNGQVDGKGARNGAGQVQRRGPVQRSMRTGNRRENGGDIPWLPPVRSFPSHLRPWLRSAHDHALARPA